MKYRLKSDHTKTIEVTPRPDPGGCPHWCSVSFCGPKYGTFLFDTALLFLEESGWEPVPEWKPVLIEDELGQIVGDSCYAAIPWERTVKALREAAATIRGLRESLGDAKLEILTFRHERDFAEASLKTLRSELKEATERSKRLEDDVRHLCEENESLRLAAVGPTTEYRESPPVDGVRKAFLDEAAHFHCKHNLANAGIPVASKDESPPAAAADAPKNLTTGRHSFCTECGIALTSANAAVDGTCMRCFRMRENELLGR